MPAAAIATTTSNACHSTSIRSCAGSSQCVLRVICGNKRQRTTSLTRKEEECCNRATD